MVRDVVELLRTLAPVGSTCSVGQPLRTLADAWELAGRFGADDWGQMAEALSELDSADAVAVVPAGVGEVALFPMAENGADPLLVVLHSPVPLDDALESLARVARLGGEALQAADLVALARLAGDHVADQRTELLEVAVSTGEVAPVVTRLALAVGSPAVLQDASMLLVASAEVPAAGMTAADIALSPSHCRLTREKLRQLEAAPAISALPAGSSAPARVVATVTAGGDVLGFLTVSAPDSPVTRDLLTQAAGLLGLQLLARDQVSQALTRDRREFFLDIVAGRSCESVVLQGLRLGHDLFLPHVPIVLALPDEAAGVRTRRLAVLEGIAREVLSDWNTGRPSAIAGLEGEHVTVFLPTDDPLDARRLVTAIQERATSSGLRLVAGWGPVCPGIEQVAEGLARARWVVDVLPAMSGSPTRAGFEDLGIYGLLYDKSDRDSLWTFAEGCLGPLMEYDADHSSPLVPTLRTLLESGGVTAAAAVLFVHISTLKYRLRKIEAVLGVDLQDPQVRFNLSLALKILEVRERVTQP